VAAGTKVLTVNGWSATGNFLTTAKDNEAYGAIGAQQVCKGANDAQGRTRGQDKKWAHWN